MEFNIVKSCRIVDNEVVYHVNDKAFDCSIPVNTDIYFTMAYLNLGVDSQDMLVKCFWGFSPLQSWIERKLKIPYAEEGSLRLLGEYEPGFTLRIDKDKKWEAYFDSQSGLYCIGKPSIEKDDNSVKILKNMVAVLSKDNHLKAIWVKPLFLE